VSKLALKIQRYCKSLLLLELLKGLAITGRHLFTELDEQRSREYT
jgi:hypothetical protein